MIFIKTLLELFERCLTVPYVETRNSADYFIEREGNTLYIYFEPSNGDVDWKNNLDFPIAPYEDMSGVKWYAHRGFLRVWKSIEEEIAYIINDRSIKRIIEVGYSHGAALATLCHEYVWYNRPDLAMSHYGFAYGSPRVIWGLSRKRVKERFSGLTVIKNIDDIVTHLPPRAIGFYHVGKLIEIGEGGKYSKIDAHRPENYIKELNNSIKTAAAKK